MGFPCFSRPASPGAFDFWGTYNNPQSAVFTAALDHAGFTETDGEIEVRDPHPLVRIQTPNINDDLILENLKAALADGVRLRIMTSSEFNAFEMNLLGLGQNSIHLHGLYKYAADYDRRHKEEYALKRSRGEQVVTACDRLDVRWYSADGIVPIAGTGAQASHAKYMSIENSYGRIAIVGSANMDFLSAARIRETNLVVDSTETTRAWDRRFDAAFNIAIIDEEMRQPCTDS